MKKLVFGLLILVVAGAAGAAYYLGWIGRIVPGLTPAGQQPGAAMPGAPGGGPGAPGAPAASPEPAQPGAPPEAAAAGAQPEPPPPAFDGNVAALRFGGMVERTTGWQPGDPDAPFMLIDGDTTGLQWSLNLGSSNWQPGPKEIVISFFNHQAVLIDRVVIAAAAGDENPRDVEVWTSTTSPSEGFTRAAATAVTFEGEQIEAAITFAPVEAKYVKLRLLKNQRGEEVFDITEVKVMEAHRDGYKPLLEREPDLGRAVGLVPAPASQKPVAVSPVGQACAPESESAQAAIKPGQGESRRVLVIDPAGSGNYPPAEDRTPDDIGKLDTSILKRITFTIARPQYAVPALLTDAAGFDTVVLAQVCDVGTDVPAGFRKALPDWVARGHKLIIHDADRCANSPDYSFLPFRFATNNPGALGAPGSDLRLLENNSIAHSRRNLPGFLNVEAWVGGEEDDYKNELGDSNTVTRWDPNWCGHLAVRNVNGIFGFSETYAHYGLGLIIYDGFDVDQWGSTGYRLLALRELQQGFNPDNLPCGARLGDFIVSTDSGLVSRPLVPGRSYAYPLTLLSNQGYKGSVSLSLSANPGLVGLKYAFEPASVSLTNVAEARLTVTIPPDAKPVPQALMVKGTDQAGNSNTLCLQLVEPKTGELSVVSMLTRAAKPTKNLEIILDVSGSMKAALGKKTRWTTALEVLRDMLARLPNDLNVGLRLYGHREDSRSPKTCTDSELVVAIQPLDREAILTAANAVKPKGETPLVYSVLQAPLDLKQVGGGTVIVITDGEESCNGDMVKAAAELKASGQSITLNIVGFTLTGQKAQAELAALATSTGGRFYAASTGDALARALLIAAIEKFPYSVFDAAGKLVMTGEAGGAPAELPPGTYRVVVQAGEQSLVAEGVQVPLGKEATVRIVIKNDRLALEK